MATKRDSIFVVLVAFFMFLIGIRILKKAISFGTTMFLILVVFLMIFLLGRM